MARARNIKPSFFANDELADLPPITRMLFIGLWMLADREGRLIDRPRRIKAEILPYDDFDAEPALQALHEGGFILRYEVNGESFIQVENFLKHQNPHIKESPSTIPAPYKHSASTVQAPDQQQPEPKPAGLNPESPFLNPDSPSLNGETRKRSTTSAKPDSVSESTWQDFLTLRKSKKAPVTDTALKAIEREADKAGVSLETALQVCCEAGWQGFNAGWYANRTASQTPKGMPSAETPYQRSMRERVAEACPEIARQDPNVVDFFRTVKPMGNVVEVEAREVERIAK